MRAKLLATTQAMPLALMATGACSREEPQPKFSPATMISPGFTRLEVTHTAEAVADVAPRDAGLAALAAGNPAAQSLRLLEHLARGEAGRCDVGYFDGSLRIEVTPT